MVAAYKAVGTIATTTGTSIAVPVTAGAAGDYAVIDLFLGGQTTAPTTPTNWTLAYSDVNGAGGSRHVYYRAFTGTVSAGNVTFTITAGGAYGKSVMHSGAGTGAPTVLSNKIDSAVSYWQSAAITTAYPRAAAHFGFINAVLTQGSLSNQGTITSTNTSRGSNDSILSAYCLHTATSAITSSAGGSVRGAFSGGSQTSWTLTVLIPEVPPAAPTGLSVTGGARELDVTFNAVSGADSYVVEWRRTDLTAPSLSTQTSAPWSLDRLDDATGLDTTYTYTWNGAGKRVYAVDSGVRGTHNEFTGRLRTGTAIGGGSTADVNGHGTQVASAAVGTTYGSAKGATLVPVRMYAGSETSYLDTDWDAFDTLIAWIIADAAGEHHVVSFSGFYPRNGQTHYAQVTAAMQSLLTAGLTVVMAAGNENTSIDLGAGYAGCIIVGGTTNTDARWDDSPGFGSVWSTGITLWAPSEDVPLALSSSDSANGTASGTSFAQPLTAGVAAKILHANPALSPPRVKEVLESQARSGILTGITTGPNLLLNGNAQTSDWSRHATGSTTLTLDGLDDAATYEIRVRTVDNGVESAASAAVSASTSSAAPVTATADPAAMIISGQTPSISGTGSASTAANPGAVTLAGMTPAIVATGAASIIPDSGSIVLTGVTPVLAGVGSVNIPVDTAMLTLAGVASDPQAGVASIAVDPGVLALGGVDPALEGTGIVTIAVDPAELTLAGVTPSTVSPVLITVDAAVLTLTGQDAVVAGSGAGSIAADVAILAIAGQDSTLAGVSASLAVDVALLTLSGQTPLLTGSGQATAGVDSATLTLAAEDAVLAGTGGTTVAVDAGMLTLVGMTPVIDGGPILVHVDVALLELIPVTPSLAGTSVSVLVDPASLLLAGVTAILATSNIRDITVTGMIDPRRWGATITPRNKTGTISPRRWEGQL